MKKKKYTYLFVKHIEQSSRYAKPVALLLVDSSFKRVHYSDAAQRNGSARHSHIETENEDVTET